MLLFGGRIFSDLLSDLLWRNVDGHGRIVSRMIGIEAKIIKFTLGSRKNFVVMQLVVTHRLVQSVSEEQYVVFSLSDNFNESILRVSVSLTTSTMLRGVMPFDLGCVRT